jgi:hypothetical protein
MPDRRHITVSAGVQQASAACHVTCNGGDLNGVADGIVRNGLLCGTHTRVVQPYGRKLSPDGAPALTYALDSSTRVLKSKDCNAHCMMGFKLCT